MALICVAVALRFLLLVFVFLADFLVVEEEERGEVLAGAAGFVALVPLALVVELARVQWGVTVVDATTLVDLMEEGEVRAAD